MSGFLMSDHVEQVKSRLNIVEVISGYLTLQRAGVNWKARCPFHNEKTPSFFVSPERQSWHCFGCNKGGDMFSFVQEIDGIEFPEALRSLASRAGVQLPEWRPEKSGERDRRQALLATTELASKFFEKQLWHGKLGQAALKYLRERNITDDTIRAWRIGWAPNDWRAMTDFLKKAGIPQADIVGAGIAIEKNGRAYDRFRSRIIFPIADANSQVIGFSGRAFGAEIATAMPAGRQGDEPAAKYVNTPQTAIYDKGKTLFGLDKARIAIRQAKRAVLVEGNVDAILSWQAGIQNTIAVSGTALTQDHLKILSRYANDIDMCFDTDSAGQVATRRSIAMALSEGFNVHVIAIDDPKAKDPADYVSAHGSKWAKLVSESKPAMEYFYSKAVAEFNPASAESKKKSLAMLAPFIKRIESRVERSHWVSALASLVRTDAKLVQADLATIEDEFAGMTNATTKQAQSPQQVSPHDLLDSLNMEILSLVVRNPSCVPQVVAIKELLDPRIASIIANPSEIQNPSDENKLLVNAAAIRAGELWGDAKPEEINQAIETIISRFSARDIIAQRDQIHREIQQAELSKDPEKVKTLLATFQKYHAELQKLQK